MPDLTIENVRGDVVESRHRVSLAVADAEGRLIARVGEPGLVTFMRSAAKPFQALPLIQDGASDHYAVTEEELALACASHSSERRQVELIRTWLERIGCSERDLVCGSHPALAADYAVLDGAMPRNAQTEIVPPSRLANNCSGKHTSMLTLAMHHGWDATGYHLPAHEVQCRIRSELARWCGVSEGEMGEGADGCGVVSFALPLDRMATGVARLITSDDRAARAVVRAMSGHPDLVAGQGRLCTGLMSRYRGRLLAKVGTAGVYIVGLIDRALGLALKVEDGDAKAAMVAVIAVLDLLDVSPAPGTAFPTVARLPIRNTRHETVGALRARGDLTFV